MSNYRQQLSDQMKRVKVNRNEMQEQGLRPQPDELNMYNFMN